MICERIKLLREKAGYSQAQLAKKLDVIRSSINAWEMGLSMPTTPYVVALSQLFHVSTDYLLGRESSLHITLDGYTPEETALIFQLLQYFDKQKHTKESR